MKKFVQFIAGAICPECKSLDTIAINANDDEIYCVKCEFKEKRPTDRDNKSEEKTPLGQVVIRGNSVVQLEVLPWDPKTSS